MSRGQRESVRPRRRVLNLQVAASFQNMESLVLDFVVVKGGSPSAAYVENLRAVEFVVDYPTLPAPDFINAVDVTVI